MVGVGLLLTIREEEKVTIVMYNCLIHTEMENT